MPCSQLQRLVVVVSVVVSAIAGSATDGVAQQPDRRGAPPPLMLVPRQEVVARHEQGKPFWETQWSVREDGALLQWPNPAAGGSTWVGMTFTGMESPANRGDPLVEMLRNRMRGGQDLAYWLAPLLRQPGDLLAATFAEHHFAQLGRDASDVALRQFLPQPAAASTEPLQRREGLDRELAIRLLQQRSVGNARGELQALAKGKGDAFVQRAAQAALATLADAPPPPRVPLQAMAIAVPAKVDLWLWLDMARIGACKDVAAAARKDRTDRMWDTLLAAGGSVNDSILSGAQFVVDLPDELPFEAARLWGRARVDQCLLGFRAGDAGLELEWAAASGAFEVEQLARHFAARQIPCAEHDGIVSSSDWWPGFAVSVAADHVVVRRAAADAAAGAWPAFATAAVAAAAALAAEIPRDSALPRLPWLLLERGEIAAVQLSPLRLRVTTNVGIDAARERCAVAANALAPGRSWKGPVLPPAVAAAWQAALRGASFAANFDTGHVRIDITGKDLDAVQLWPLLR